LRSALRVGFDEPVLQRVITLVFTAICGLYSLTAEAADASQTLSVDAMIAADPELRDLADKIAALRKQGLGAEWKLAWALENAADQLNSNYVINPAAKHPIEARQLLTEELLLLPRAHKPETLLGPGIAFLKQQCEYGLGKAVLDIYEERGSEYDSAHLDTLTMKNPPPLWEATPEAVHLLADAAASFRGAIAEEANVTAQGDWQPEADQMMRARLGLLQSVWSRRIWPETFDTAQAVYNFLYALSPAQGELSFPVQQRAESQLRGLVTGYLGYLKLQEPGTRSDEYLFRVLQMAESSYDLHALDLASSQMPLGVSGATGPLQDYQLALEDARRSKRDLYRVSGVMFNRLTSFKDTLSDPAYTRANGRLRDALARADKARAELAVSHPFETSILTPRIISIRDVQAALRPHEALLFIYIDPIDSVS
jgi:hypothetical protein